MNTIIPIIRRLVPMMLAIDRIGMQPMILSGMETGQTYKNDAALYSDAEIDEVEYYWVHVHLHHGAIFRIKEAANEFDEMHQWCCETFTVPALVWASSDGKFYFKNEADRTLFLLRWA